MRIPTYPGNAADSANPREGEHVAALSHGTDRVRLDRRRNMALPVTQPIADGRPVAHTAASNRRNVARYGANEKGKTRLECAATVHFMQSKGWETLLDECVHKGGMEGGCVVGLLWVDICRKWWTSFSAICVFA